MPDIHIDDETFAALERLAASDGCSVSDLVRRATYSAPPAGAGLPVEATPMTLTAFQREQLAVQREVFGWIYTMLPEVAGEREILEAGFDEHAHMAEILRNGWTAQYEHVFAKVKPELPLEVCAFVKNVLSMFGDVSHSLEQLPQGDLEALGPAQRAVLRFRGFGWRDERRLADYARFLIVDDKDHAVVRRFPGVVEDGLTTEFPWAGDTSHAEEYLRMLTAFDGVTDGEGIDEDEPLTLTALSIIATAGSAPAAPNDAPPGPR